MTLVLQGSPTYSISTFRMPITMCEAIDGAMRWFWWSDDGSKNHVMALKKWDELCKRKRYSGLRIHKTQDFNTVILEKVDWKLINNENVLWCKLLGRKYGVFKEDRILRAKASVSLVWKAIIYSSSLLHKGGHLTIRNRENDDIWSSPWVTQIDGDLNRVQEMTP